jgi:hypothetical protein
MAVSHKVMIFRPRRILRKLRRVNGLKHPQRAVGIAPHNILGVAYSLSCRELDFEQEETTNARMTVNRYIRFLIVSVFTYFRIARIRVMLSPHAIKWLFSHPKKSW